MQDNLVIVESPAKAKTIEKFLGKDYIVKSSFGHIRDLSKKDLGINIDDGFKPTMLSTPFTQMLCHKLRAENDAILVGRVTAERDRPRLNVRLWSGPDPMPVTLDRNRPFSPDADFSRPVIPQLFSFLHGKGVQSLIVEGGAETLGRFMDYDNWWDEIRVETSPKSVTGGTRAPQMPGNVRLSKRAEYDGNVIETYVKDED